MLKYIKRVENFLYGIRDLLWSYPDILIGDTRLKAYLLRTYNLSIPYSHMILATIVMIIMAIFLFSFSKGIVAQSRDIILIEGVVMGVDSNGELQKINKVNPLLPSNVQLEKDLVDLIYEPLIIYEYKETSKGKYEPTVTEVLAENVIKIKQGADYQFNLKRGVKWHDGKEFTSDDVVSTLEKISNLEGENAYIQAVKQLQWEKLGKYSLRICTKPLDSEDLTCNERSDNPIFSNFLELLSIKIIPKHLSGDITASNADSGRPNLYRSPVGTGKYKFSEITDKSINLVVNDEYHHIEDIPSIDQIRFVFYRDLESAAKAVENGEAHTLASVSTQYLKQLNEFPKVKVQASPVLYNQFWGLYFNLRKTPDGQAIGPEFFQDKKVRQAISYAISRQSIIDSALSQAGQEAFGPIPSISEFFNVETKWKTYNKAAAEKLLDESGWTIKPGDEYRTNKDLEVLRFSLYFVDNYDRRRIAESIKADLADVGIDVVIDRKKQPGQSEASANGWTLQELNEQVVAPRLFDAVLYGMNTFIDPDRYELYHSSQQNHPGLNIAGYTGSVETVKPREDRKEGEESLVRLPKVDRLLEQTRSFDPDNNKEERLRNYKEFQDLLAEDAPLVFLYHPKFLYYVNNDLKNVNLQNVSSVEDRFRNISEWNLE